MEEDGLHPHFAIQGIATLKTKAAAIGNVHPSPEEFMESMGKFLIIMKNEFSEHYEQERQIMSLYVGIAANVEPALAIESVNLYVERAIPMLRAAKEEGIKEAYKEGVEELVHVFKSVFQLYVNMRQFLDSIPKKDYSEFLPQN